MKIFEEKEWVKTPGGVSKLKTAEVGVMPTTAQPNGWVEQVYGPVQRPKLYERADAVGVHDLSHLVGK